MVEMVWLDVCCEVSMMSSYAEMLRYGHLQQMYHMFSYLKLHQNTILVLDQTYPDISQNDSEQQEWKEFYRDLSFQVL